MSAESLFVYGTLRPGQPNEHVLQGIGGTFQPATLRGHLHAAGWGASLGSPGLIPDPAGDVVAGFLFTSENLSQHWPTLDAFEGQEYERTRVIVQLDSGESRSAWVYALHL